MIGEDVADIGHELGAVGPRRGLFRAVGAVSDLLFARNVADVVIRKARDQRVLEGRSPFYRIRKRIEQLGGGVMNFPSSRAA